MGGGVCGTGNSALTIGAWGLFYGETWPTNILDCNANTEIVDSMGAVRLVLALFLPGLRLIGLLMHLC